MTPKTWEKDEKSYLWRHVPTGTYYVRRKRKGKKPLFKSTGEKVKTRAKTKADEMISAWLGGRPVTHRDEELFGPFAQKYLEFVLRSSKLKPRTKEQAKIYISELIERLRYVALSELNEGFVEEWIEELKREKDRKTFQDYVKYLSKVLRHAHIKGLIQRLPQFQNPDPKKKTGRVYTHEEVSALIAECSPKLELQFRLCLQSIMRLREMLALEWNRVNLETGLITLRAEDVKTGSRTGEGRSFFVNKTILKQLRTRREKMPTARYVFPSPKGDTWQWSNKKAWGLAKRKAGIKGKARWHDLRHTALTWALVEKKMNPLFVSKYAGVSMRTIERVYLKVRPEDTAEIAKAIDI